MSGCTRAAWAAALIALPSMAAAQTCTPGWGAPFPNAPGLNNEVRELAFFDDGQGPRLYAAGFFEQSPGPKAVGITRWNGTAWEALPQGGLSGDAYCVGVYDLGTGPALYVGGSFTKAGGSPAANIARWDGQHWSALGLGTNNTVRAMTVYDDGSGPALYATGLFTIAGGAPASRVARWDGQGWTDVGGGLTQGGTGYSIGVFDLGDGPKLYLGGNFGVVGGVAARNIARWDGKHWSPMGLGLFGGSELVMRMAMFDDGSGPKLHIAGRFDVSPARPGRARVARWIGASWQQVGSDLSGLSSDYVNSLAVLPRSSGPELYVGGVFTGATWLNNVNYVARLSNGDWLGVEGGMDAYVRSMMVATEGGKDVIFASGNFEIAGAAVASRVARFEGEHWAGLENSFGLMTESFAAHVFQGKVYVATFGRAGRVAINGIASWDGSAWDAVGGGVQRFNGTTPYVNAMIEHDDGGGPALYATGTFDLAGGGPAPNIARWDGAHWSSLEGTGLNGSGSSMAVHDDGSGPALYVAGNFTLAGATPVSRIARWNGGTWSAVGPDTGATLFRSIAVYDAGEGPMLYATGKGAFSTGSGDALLRWDGVTWTVLDISVFGETGERADDLTVFDDGAGPELFAIGDEDSLLRWAGDHWWYPTWNGGLSGPECTFDLSVIDDGSGPALFAAGKTWQATPSAPVYARLRYRRAGVWHDSLEPGLTGHWVSALAAGDVGGHRTIFVAGQLTKVADLPTANFAQWNTCPPCYMDCAASGTLDINDFVCFQTKFALGDAYADCDENGKLNLSDFICFQTRFAAGCP